MLLNRIKHQYKYEYIVILPDKKKGYYTLVKKVRNWRNNVCFFAYPRKKCYFCITEDNLKHGVDELLQNSLSWGLPKCFVVVGFNAFIIAAFRDESDK